MAVCAVLGFAARTLMMVTLRTTALVDEHRTASARMVDFGGWEMPMEYSAGLVAEHRAVRSDVGVFDVSHMGNLVLQGSGAATALNRILTNDLGRIGSGKAQYTLLCSAAGGVLDDMLVYRISDDLLRIVPNSANAEAVRDILTRLIPSELEIIDCRLTEGILALQGPRSPRVLGELDLLPDDQELAYMDVVQGQFYGHPVLVSRSGYTGEVGYEIFAPNAVLGRLWQSMLARGVTAAGLGARDTLRTEMGYPLHGHELSQNITALEAGLAWAIGWSKSEFVGREALLEDRKGEQLRILRGLWADGRGVPRAGMLVRTSDGHPLGLTTSGTHSPTLRTGIALALLNPRVELGDEVAIDVRGRPLAARVVRTPFVESSPK